jgi:hypothetical protein
MDDSEECIGMDVEGRTTLRLSLRRYPRISSETETKDTKP